MQTDLMDLELPVVPPMSPQEVVDTLLGYADMAVSRHTAGELRWLRCHCLSSMPNTPERALFVGVIERRIRQVEQPRHHEAT